MTNSSNEAWLLTIMQFLQQNQVEMKKTENRETESLAHKDDCITP